MLDPFFMRLLKSPLDHAGATLADRNISANSVTWAGFAAGLVGALAIAGGFYTLAIFILALNRLADGLDGAVARATRPTDFGAYLDIVLDFIVYTAVAAGVALADPENTTAAVVLMISFMGTASAFLAFAIVAAKRGLEGEAAARKSFFYVGGLTEGSETIIFFLAVLLWPSIFSFTAWIFSALCWITIAQRIRAARARFDAPSDLPGSSA